MKDLLESYIVKYSRIFQIKKLLIIKFMRYLFDLDTLILFEVCNVEEERAHALMIGQHTHRS